jgi:hypothetical protein
MLLVRIVHIMHLFLHNPAQSSRQVSNGALRRLRQLICLTVYTAVCLLVAKYNPVLLLDSFPYRITCIEHKHWLVVAKNDRDSCQHVGEKRPDRPTNREYSCLGSDQYELKGIEYGKEKD